MATNLLLTVVCGALCSVCALAQEAQAQNQPAVIRAVAPVFPLIAATARVSGMVRVEVQINPSGEVTSVKSIEGLRLLEAAAESAAGRWLFTAAGDSGGGRTARLTFEFKLVSDETPAADTLPVFEPPYKVVVHSEIPVVIDSPNIDPPPGRKRVKARRRNR